MKIKTKEHFKKLVDIIKDDGILSALDYDLQITRNKRSLFNYICAEIISDLNNSFASCYYGRGESEHHTSYYCARYKGGRLVNLEIK